jgi:ABC-type iron transport system FetAB ATPase subunit
MLPAESQWWYDTVGMHFQTSDRDRLDALGFEEDVMSWTVSRLSTGERQRLALVRLLANRPRTLLLDEPTASLDTENVSRVEEIITCYRSVERASVLWVTHDRIQAERVASRHFELEEGKLVLAKGA